MAADPSFPYKVFIEQARMRWEPVAVFTFGSAAKDSVSPGRPLVLACVRCKPASLKTAKSCSL